MFFFGFKLGRYERFYCRFDTQIFMGSIPLYLKKSNEAIDHAIKKEFQFFLQDCAASHRTASLCEGIGLVLEAEHGQVLAARVLQRTLAIGSDADIASLRLTKYNAVIW